MKLIVLRNNILWGLSRYLKYDIVPNVLTCQTPNISSFAATDSLLHSSSEKRPVTRIAFTPIIPHPATEFNTIHTAMVNYQDVLKQKGLDSGPLWCDEGVYRIVKELQMLNPTEFGNIFLGLGGFHTEKVFIACCGVYLESIGVEKVFVENEIFGPATVNSVMNGGNYIRGKRGMGILAEGLKYVFSSQNF